MMMFVSLACYAHKYGGLSLKFQLVTKESVIPHFYASTTFSSSTPFSRLNLETDYLRFNPLALSGAIVAWQEEGAINNKQEC
jgi:hypothetical protein